MSCRISAMHHPPPVPSVDRQSPPRGEDFTEAGTALSRLQSTDGVSTSPPGDNVLDPPSFSKSKKGLLFSPPQAGVGGAPVEGESCGRCGLFSGCGGVLVRTGSQISGMDLCGASSLLQMEPRPKACSPQKGLTIQAVASRLILTAKQVCV